MKEGKARQAGQVMQAAPAVKIINCKNCGAENPSSERVCSKCGAPLPRTVVEPVPAAGVVTPAAKAQPKKVNWLLFGGIGAFLAVCCIAIFALFVFPSKSVEGTVADVFWQTSVPLQEIRAVNYSNERGSPPSGAYDVSCHTESQEICEDKTVDRGNGFAEVVTECRTESQDYCSYTVDEWATIQSYDLSGSDLFPEYAEPSVFNGQRLGNASANLTVTFSTPKGEITYSPGSVSEFQQFQIGSTWTLKLNALGGVLSVGGGGGGGGGGGLGQVSVWLFFSPARCRARGGRGAPPEGAGPAAFLCFPWPRGRNFFFFFFFVSFVLPYGGVAASPGFLVLGFFHKVLHIKCRKVEQKGKTGVDSAFIWRVR
ncbi:zinc-ribbon domain-containing protein [Candidatus Villigracilis affinis]|uniref:zinc-ribbon domain-containing protein n=1 Tax=Candidatus Villigracilis affinis TaxID=3140682 RepID=UPI0031EAF796